jgi:lipoyl(octanoyl) transferase
MTRRGVDTAYLGRIDYPAGVRLQDERVAAVQEGRRREALFLLEHDPVLTLGRGARRENIVAGEDELRRLGIAVHACGRGGDVTYHGPGQLVGYPILDLAPDRKDVWRYVRDLEEALILTLAEYGIEARRFQRLTGVWVGEEKIAAIGVRVSRWVTSHGFALNVATDLSHFRTIVPCGIREYGVTGLDRLLGTVPDVAEVARRFAPHFGRVFDREVHWSDPAAMVREGAEVAR